MGTWVEKPRRFAAVAPVEMITALSLLAISDTSSKAEGYRTPKRVLRALTEVNLSKLAVGNLALNLVNYSVLHIDIGLILVGMITNISDCKNTIFLSNNNVFSLEIKFSWLKKASLLSFELHFHKILFVVSTF